jgi:hypothetical protein
MAFKYIDNAAFSGCNNDGPRSAAAMTMLRNNIAQVWDERGPRAGVRFHKPARLCSPYRVAYGPFLLDLKDEAYDHIEMHLYLSAVDWSESAEETPADGTDAVYLCATTITPDGRVDYPPEDLDDWDDYCSVSLPLTKTATDQMITLTAPLGAKRGVVGVLLWVVSELSSSAESTSLVEETTIPYDGLNCTTAPSYTANPIERAITLRYASDKSATTNYMDAGQLAIAVGYRSENSNHIVYTMPPLAVGSTLASIYGGDVQVGFFTMGVAEITGLEVEAIPGSYLGPSAAAMSIGSRLDEPRMAGLVVTARHLARKRTRTYSCHPGMYLIDSTWHWWAIFNDDLAGHYDNLTNSYTVVHEAIISQPPPSADRVGYTAWVLLASCANSSENGNDIIIKLSLDDLSDNSSPFTSYGNSTQTERLKFSPKYGPTNWTPIGQNLLRSVELQLEETEMSQTRGMLVDPTLTKIEARTGVPDFQRLQWMSVELDEPGGASYPALARIWLARGSDYSVTTQTAVVAAGVFGRAL